MKKVLSLLLVGLIVVGLSGCVNISNPEDVDCDLYPTHVDCVTDGPIVEGPPGLVNVLSELPDEEITITFWHVYGQSKEALLLDYIAEFEEMYPNVTIEASSQGGYDDLRNKTILAISAGETPTMLVGYPDHVAGYLNGSAVIPLDDFIYDETHGVDLDDFIPSYVDENRQYAGGYMYSLPYSKSTEMMVINVDKFAANGITVPTDRPLTFTELETYADTMVGTGENQCEYLINYDSSANFFINNVRMWGGGYTNTAGEILVEDENTISMLETVSAYFQDKTIALPIAWNQQYGSTNFKEGDACMTVGSTAGISYNIPSGDNAFEIAVAPIPQWDADNMSAVQQGPNVAIMSNSTDAERLAAWLFIKYITEAEQTAEWSMLTGYLPVRYSAFNSDKYQFFLDVTDIDGSGVEALIDRYVADNTDIDASIASMITYYEANKADLDGYYTNLLGDDLDDDADGTIVDDVLIKVYENMNTYKYESLTAQAAYLQIDYQDFDPAFAKRTTSSDARVQAGIVMEAIFVGNVTIEEAIEDMLYQLGVE